jgi:peptide deformylase
MSPARSIVPYPDPRLEQKAAPVAVFDADLATLLRDILDTMDAVQAVGLTAVHIGVPARLAVIRLDPTGAPLVVVNPEVVEASAETASHTEGSVSLPGVAAAVTRPARIRLRYRDPDGTPREMDAEGFLAACLQHEIDQLDGVFWLARLSRLKRDRILKKLQDTRRRSRTG